MVDDVGLRERLRRDATPRSTKPVEGPPETDGVVSGGANPQVDIAGRPRDSVAGDRVRADYEKLNAFGGQGIQHLGEVAIHRKAFR